MVWRDVKPWRRELREDFSFVSADLGPRDLAPLARAVSDLSCDGMCGAPELDYTLRIFTFSGLLGFLINHNRGISVLICVNGLTGQSNRLSHACQPAPTFLQQVLELQGFG